MLNQRQHRLWAAVEMLAALLAMSTVARAESVELRAGGIQLRIDTTGGLPAELMSCAGPCDGGGNPRQLIVGGAHGKMTWFSSETADAEATSRVQYVAEIHDGAQAVVAILKSVDSVGGVSLVQRYELSRTTHVLRMQLRAPPGVGLAMASGSAFIPEQLPGLLDIHPGALPGAKANFCLQIITGPFGCWNHAISPGENRNHTGA